MIDNGQEEKNGGAHGEAPDEETKGIPSEEVQKERVKEQRSVPTGLSPQDVPDGAQISKAFDTLCNIVRDRMRKYKKPEPIADFYTKGRYVLVTGDGSYLDPCFYTSTPSAGHIYVTIRDGMMYPYEPYGRSTPSPPPPQPMTGPRPLSPTQPLNGKEGNKGERGKDNGGKGKQKSGEPQPHSKDPSPVPPPGGPSSGPKDSTPAAHQSKKNKDDGGPNGPTPKPVPRGASTSSSSSSSTSTSTSTSSGSFTPDTMSYEKVEVVESVEKFSNDRKVKGYEETSMVVETTIEKSSKKKH